MDIIDHLVFNEISHRPILVFHSYLLLFHCHSVSFHSSSPTMGHSSRFLTLDKFYSLCCLSASKLTWNIISGYLWITSYSNPLLKVKITICLIFFLPSFYLNIFLPCFSQSTNIYCMATMCQTLMLKMYSKPNESPCHQWAENLNVQLFRSKIDCSCFLFKWIKYILIVLHFLYCPGDTVFLSQLYIQLVG